MTRDDLMLTGWRQMTAGDYAILRTCGVEFRSDPEAKFGVQIGDMTKMPWAPAWAVRIARNGAMTPQDKIARISQVTRDPTWVDALQAAAALGGDLDAAINAVLCLLPQPQKHR